MNKIANLEIIDECNIRFHGLDLEVRKACVSAVKHFIPSARYSPAFKIGRWDGTKSFATLGGRSYLNLLDKLLPIVINAGYEIEITDNRKEQQFLFDTVTEDTLSDKVWPVGHREQGKPIKIRDYQVQAINECLNNVQGITIAPTSAGKAQPLYSKVLVPNGWKRIGDLEINDKVLTPSGSISNVVGIYDKGVKPVYEIIFEDGRIARSCDEHLWKVFVNNEWKVLPLHQLVNEKNLTEISIQLPTLENDLYSDNFSDTYQLGRAIRFNTKSDNKFLDIASLNIRQRLQLLNGILDNEYVINDDHISLTVDNIDLLELIIELSRSVGCKTFVKNINDTSYQISLYHENLQLLVNTNFTAFDKNKLLFFKEINFVSNDYVRCIMLDDDDHLYVTDNYVVTHNTIITATLSLMAEKYGRTLVIVPNKNLVQQTEEDFRNIGLDVGVLYGDRKEYDRKHTICTWQSLNVLDKKSKDNLSDDQLAVFLHNQVAVICDEVHLVQNEGVLHTLLTTTFSNIPIRWGLTGTIPKEEHVKHSLISAIGPVIGQLSAKELQDKGYLANCHVKILQLQDTAVYNDYQSELKFLVTNRERLTWIASHIKEVSKTGNTLVLFDRKDTGKILQEMIPDSTFISGDISSNKRRVAYKEINFADNAVMLATMATTSTGISINRIFNIVLIEPGKSFVRVIQSIGRGLRKADDKDFVQIYDVTSNCKFSRRHLTERKKYYKEAEYPADITKIVI